MTHSEKLNQYIEILKKEFPELQYVNGALEPDKIKVCTLGRYFSIGVYNMTRIDAVSFYKYVDENIYKVCYDKGDIFPNIYTLSEPLNPYEDSYKTKEKAKEEVLLIVKNNEGYPHLGEAYTGILHRHPASDKWPEMKKHVVVDLKDWEYARELIKSIGPLLKFLEKQT